MRAGDVVKPGDVLGTVQSAALNRQVIEVRRQTLKSGQDSDLERAPAALREAVERALGHARVPCFSTKVAGAGLGLTLCREIIEAHGGRLRIANREGGVAVVAVWLPDSV